MIAVRRFLSRRTLLAVLGVAAILCGFLMLHPYPRQAPFGPTIDGKPWCVWEDEVRRRCDGGRPASWPLRLWQRFAAWTTESPRLDLANEEALPVYLKLADDSDVEVRRFALSTLKDWGDHFPRRDHVILPIMRRHLQDEDADCRSSAVCTLVNAIRTHEFSPCLFFKWGSWR